MSPYEHAVNSAKRFGGSWQEYVKIHRFLDSTKTHTVDNSHRMILHNSFGIEICERIFGDVVQLQSGDLVEIRYIVMEHIKEDLGFVPTVKEWCNELNHKPWMSGNNIVKTTFNKSNIYDTGEQTTEAQTGEEKI